jgi:hypothetical protein
MCRSENVRDRDRDRDRVAAMVVAINSAATFHQLCDSVDELTELLADPDELPKLAAVSVMTLYRRLVAGRAINQRLRRKLRALLG